MLSGTSYFRKGILISKADVPSGFLAEKLVSKPVAGLKLFFSKVVHISETYCTYARKAHIPNQ